MVQQGAFIGLGRTGIPLIMGILRIWLLRYLFILATEHVLGFYSVFWGNLFSNYMAAIITTVLMMRIKWVSAISQGVNKNDNTVKINRNSHEFSGSVEWLEIRILNIT
jgi:Na+-driven multidrug efflux pump